MPYWFGFGISRQPTTTARNTITLASAGVIGLSIAILTAGTSAFSVTTPDGENLVGISGGVICTGTGAENTACGTTGQVLKKLYDGSGTTLGMSWQDDSLGAGANQINIEEGGAAVADNSTNALTFNFNATDFDTVDTANNVAISLASAGGGTTYTAGEGLSLTGTEFSRIETITGSTLNLTGVASVSGALSVDGMAYLQGGVTSTLTGNADSCTALASNPTDCGANTFAQSIVASGDLTCGAIGDADVPNTITIDLATTATTLADNGANCNAGEIALGVDAVGAAEGCYEPTEADITDLNHLATSITDGLIVEADLNEASGTPTDLDVLTYNSAAVNFNWVSQSSLVAGTATALVSNPTDCSANQFAQSIVASGDLTCSAIGDADVPNTITIDLATAATSLAANGGNCLAGSYPLGVDASGAVESCTDATTEIDSAISTHAGVPTAHQALVTLAGQDYLTLSTQQITAGEIEPDDLAASDFGGFTCDGATCTIDAVTIHNSGALVYGYDGDTQLSTQENAQTLIAVHTGTFTEVQARTQEAPTGSSLIFDVKECDSDCSTSCTTLFSTKPTIADGALVDDDNAVFSDTTITYGQCYIFDIDQIGSTLSGTGLTLQIGYSYTKTLE